MPHMESRMRGNSHVRFGAGDEETCLGNEARRFIPTLPTDPVRTLTPQHRRPDAHFAKRIARACAILAPRARAIQISALLRSTYALTQPTASDQAAPC